MKRIFLIAAAALVVLAGCKAKSAEEVLSEYRADVDQIEQSYYEAAAGLDDAAGEKLLEDTINKLIDSGMKLLGKYPSDPEIAPAVLSSIYSYLDDGKLMEVIEGLGEAVKQSEIVS